MFANNRTPDGPFNPNKIAEAIEWKEMEKQNASIDTIVPIDSLKLYAGRYDFMNGAVMQITLEDNKLFAQLSGQGKFEIFPSSQNEFFWKVVDARIKFIRNDSAVISHAIFRQNGQELNVRKLKEEQIIAINPALLDRYTGKYKYINDMVVTISKENDRLFAQATGQGKLEMFPVSDTQFVLKEINARVTFKDEGGKVNKLMLNLNGTDSELPRME